uniref:Pollen Ole e 1 allergen and extensin family protein n=1 Tax=Davidia involucrata TaxID=16924 RepID=A0A5B7BWR8_DAVIN
MLYVEASLPPPSPKLASMDLMLLFVLLLASLCTHPLMLAAQPSKPTSHITVVGAVFCDVCYNNTFSRHSYFLPGVDVHIECKFKANSPRTTEQIAFSVNRTTDKYGLYKLEIPSVEGVDCVEGPAIQSFCQASLIGSSSSACNVPGLKTSSNEITVKSKQASLCIYSLSALSYRPPYVNLTLCGNHKEELLSNSLNSSKFFLPHFPPYGFPWPPLPQLPPLPQFPPLPQLPPLPSLPPLPPFPSLPFPPLPPFPSFPFPPLPFPKPPSLPFPFPPLPPFTPIPPLLSPPPPPAFNLGDPRTWIPNIPFFSPPPPPAFNLRDPRTWIPYIPPSPPNSPQNQQP